MIKTLCCLGSATLGVLLLSACGSTAQLPSKPDISKLSTGDGNSVASGGYFWTYTDHNAASSQYHATSEPHTDMNTPLTVVADSDPAHGNVIKITGSVPPQIPWSLVSTQDPTSIDTYWVGLYPDSKIPAYPTAGVGFGWQANNKPFDATQGGKYVGVAFDLKLNDASMTTLWTSYPMVGTDLPDKNFNDDFPKPGEPGGCTYYTAPPNDPVNGYQTCFTNYRKTYTNTNPANAYSALAPAGTWKRYCTLFSEVGIPSWANTATQSKEPSFDPTKLLKMQWDMFQPADGAATAKFDISLDNVNLVTAKDAADPANNCNPGMIDAGPGSGGEG